MAAKKIIAGVVDSDVNATAHVPHDRELLKRYGDDGDMNAFDILVDRHERELMCLAGAMVGEEHAAREAVHDGFLKLGQQAQRLLAAPPHESGVRAWLCRVVRNACIDHLRKEKRRRWFSFGEREPAQERPATDHLAEADGAQRIWSAVADLPPLERAAVCLRYRENRSYQEIAEALGKSVSHVGVILHAAVGRLRASAALQAEVTP